MLLKNPSVGTEVRHSSLVAGLALMCLGFNATATPAPSAPSVAPVAPVTPKAPAASASNTFAIQDTSSWKDANVWLRSDVQDIADTSGITGAVKYYAPRQSKFTVVSDTPVVDPTGANSNRSTLTIQFTYVSNNAPTTNVQGEVVKIGPQYKVDKGAIENTNHVLSEWTTGILFVPYKYGLANHSLTQGSITIGPYFGRSAYFSSLDITITIPIAAGISNVSVPSLQNGTAVTTQKTGLSIATGFVANISGKLNTGLLLGVDQLGPNSGYQDNGKLWLGLYIGAGF